MIVVGSRWGQARADDSPKLRGDGRAFRTGDWAEEWIKTGEQFA